jgi:hypothetical protein
MDDLRPNSHFLLNQLMNTCLHDRVCAGCVSLFASQEEISMARKVGQIIARGDRRWLIRVYLGRDHQTKKRKYHNRTIHGPMREAQAYLTRKLRERDLGRDLEGAKITLNEYLDRCLETAVKPGVRRPTRTTTACCSATSDRTWAKEYWLQCALWTFKLLIRK